MILDTIKMLELNLDKSNRKKIFLKSLQFSFLLLTCVKIKKVSLWV